MNKSISIIFMCLTFAISYGQTNFSNGFETGFKRGYCQDKGVGCVAPVPPVSPTPNVNESSSSYKDGYDRGFIRGQNESKKDDSSGNSSTRKRYETSDSEFIDYSYNPNYEFAYDLIKNVTKGLEDANAQFMSGNFDNTIFICKKVLELLPGQVKANQYLSFAYLAKYKQEGKASLAILARHHAKEVSKVKGYEFFVKLIKTELEKQE